MAKLSDIQSIIMQMASNQQLGQYHVDGNTAPEAHDVVQMPRPQYNSKPNTAKPVPAPQNVFKPKKEEAKPVVNSSVETAAADEYAAKIDAAVKTLVAGKDYCKINNIKEPVILRSGLVKILRNLQYRHNSKLIDKQLKDGVLAYTVEVTVIDADGCVICSALGSSNSSEKKFSDKGLSSDNILTAIASTRALRSCVKDILVR